VLDEILGRAKQLNGLRGRTHITPASSNTPARALARSDVDTEKICGGGRAHVQPLAEDCAP